LCANWDRYLEIWPAAGYWRRCAPGTFVGPKASCEGAASGVFVASDGGGDHRLPSAGVGPGQTSLLAVSPNCRRLATALRRSGLMSGRQGDRLGLVEDRRAPTRNRPSDHRALKTPGVDCGWLMDGTGMRLMACIRLRAGDLDLGNRLIVVRNGKGGKDRFVPLPERLRLWSRTWSGSRHCAIAIWRRGRESARRTGGKTARTGQCRAPRPLALVAEADGRCPPTIGRQDRGP